MNLVASLQDRLRNQARQTGMSYASLLKQFALSRFFARLAQSAHANRFVLKGANFFAFLSEPDTARLGMRTFLVLATMSPRF
ncbi:MAG: hypothetical protein ACI9DF_005046 [Verrucomicrobiales bacterium]|jgi:hypothetical protein